MRILVVDKLAQAGVDALAVDHEVDVNTGLSKAELIAIVADYDAIVVRSATTIDADVIAAATNLKVVGRAGVGLDNVDIEAATRSGVVVCNAPQSNIVSAAEHTMALLLALARNVPQAHAALIDGRWERSSWNGSELHDKTLGVLGLGRIGTLVAQRAHAFGMRLIAFDPFVAPDRAARLGVHLADTVDEVLAEADFVTIHLPKTPDTVGLFDLDRLGKMKPTARLLNVARGGIVVEADLAKALADGLIAGAAVDVFDVEPTTDSPLFGLPNLIVTPHLGASTEEAQDRAGIQVAEAVDLALKGELVPSAVNVQGGPVPDAVKPYLPLAEKLGRLLAALADDGLTGEVTVETAGAIADEDTRIVGLSVIKGLLSAVVSEPVTFVNAPLFADERGLSVREVSDPHSEDYVSVLRVSGLTRDGHTVRVSGTVVQPGDRERLIEVWDTPVDVEPSEHMAFFRYEDRPGVIGSVGTGFGEAGVNIASAQVGRRAVGGEAIMALSLDDAVPRDVLADIAARIGADEGRAITLS
ncbi:MAG: phosphoglycerate dehydrogenase [Nitriliruptor sp.]|uniref:phosphoglycerate dehydrogenase n=1 Tax=Nitriliruptor sp. TaxID=2448056 RepID=UPI0034A044CF